MELIVFTLAAYRRELATVAVVIVIAAWLLANPLVVAGLAIVTAAVLLLRSTRKPTVEELHRRDAARVARARRRKSA